jgi:hypothetical protein
VKLPSGRAGAEWPAIICDCSISQILVGQPADGATMSDQMTRLDHLSNSFARHAHSASWVRAAFILKAGRFVGWVLGRECDSNVALVGVHRSAHEGAILSELYALTDQASILVWEIIQSGHYQQKPFTMKSVHYDFDATYQFWLFFLLHFPPMSFQCRAKGSGIKGLAISQIGESEVPIWIDSYPQVCVSALAWLKSNTATGIPNKQGQQTSLPCPWEGDDDWDDLEPQVRRLLRYMQGQEKADLRELCPVVWEKDFADVSKSARETATCKANTFLRKHEASRFLVKIRKEPYLKWE